MTNYTLSVSPSAWTLTPQVVSESNAVLFGSLALALAGDTRLLTPALEARGEAFMQQAQSHGLNLAPAAVAPLFAGTVDVPMGQSVMRGMPLADDPTWRTGGDFPVPAAVRTQIKRMQPLKKVVATYYIFHDLPREVAALPHEYALPYMVPPPPASRLREAKALGDLTDVVGKFGVGALVAGGALALGAATVATGGAALVGALALSALALDPVVMAVLVDPQQGLRPGAPALWVPVAAWRY